MPNCVNDELHKVLRILKLTTTLTQLLDSLLNRSPPVVPQTLLPVVLVDGRVLAVTEETGAGVLEGGHCDRKSGAVTDRGGNGAYCAVSVCGYTSWTEMRTSKTKHASCYKATNSFIVCVVLRSQIRRCSSEKLICAAHSSCHLC